MLLILFFLIVAIVTLKIRVNFKDIKISNIDESGEKKELKKTYNVNFEIFINSHTFLNLIKQWKVSNGQYFTKINNKK